MPEKKKQNKKPNVKVHDLKASKDAKGGGIQFQGPGGTGARDATHHRET